MRLGLFDRIRRLTRSRRPKVGTVPGTPGGSGTQGRHRRRGPAVPAVPPPPPSTPGSLSFPGPESPGGADMARDGATGSVPRPGGPPADRAPAASRPAGPPSMRAGAARVRIREAPPDAAAIGTGEAARPVAARSGQQARWAEAVQPAQAQAEAAAAARSAGLARVAAGVPRQPDGLGRPSERPAMAVSHSGLPFAPAHPRERPRVADGRRNCGSLEAILWRQWDPASPPPREVIAAVDRLAELPMRIKEKLAAGLDAIFVGPGGVPELDDMTSLRGVPLPAGRATWDACAGAYGERKIVVGSRPSPTPDVMCHEVGHALDDLDSPPGKWQSDSAEFRMLYDQCQPNFASDFHRQPGGLGRKEFFADAFSAIASRQRPALVDMLSGDTRTALQVMLYFNRRYGI
jgi:hypothetical protein